MIDRHLKEEYEKQAPILTFELRSELAKIEAVLNNPSRSEVEEDKAMRDLSRFAENKIPYASAKLISLGEEFRKKGNLTKALHCCELAVKGGDPQAVLALGIYYLYYLPVAKKEEAEEYYKKSAVLFRPLADKGDINSIYHIAKALVLLGQSEQARRWFELGTKKEDADCMFELGKLIFETQPHSLEGLVWLEKAAAKNQSGAIAFIYQLIKSEESKGNLEKSFAYCKLLADLFNPEALNYLAVCYQSGRGTSASPEKAESFFLLAANLGSIKAMMNLAEIYKNSDRNNYLKWLSKAAEKGEKVAKFTLAKETMDITVLGEFAKTGEQIAVAAYIAALSQVKKMSQPITSLDPQVFMAVLAGTLNANNLANFQSLIEANETIEIIAKEEFKLILNQLLPRALLSDSVELLQLIQRKIPLDPSQILLEAVIKRSFRCLNSLLTGKEAPGANERLSLASLAARRGDLTTTLILCPDKERAAKLLFEDYLLKNTDEELNLHLLTLLRFAAIEQVDELVSLFECDDKMKSKLQAQYQKAKDIFLQSAPYFARLTSQAQLSDLGRGYKNSEYGDLKVGCKKDMEYGEKRKALTEQLYRNLTQTHSSCLPTRTEFLTRLPPSSANTRRVAAMLEMVAAWVSNNQSSNDDKEQFSALRTNGHITPAGGRYAWALAMLKSIHAYSPSINKDPTGVPGYHLIYQIKGEDIVLNEIKLQEDIKADLSAQGWWYHGRAPLEKTWPLIEDLFEKILSMDLKNTAELYSSMAEFVWLIGNTQPLMRGSGSFAEIMLALMHLHHGLKPPVLKVEFPQLDVLDLSFPLKDYKSFFSYFFEPCSIPEPLRQLSRASFPLEEQIKILYEGSVFTESQTASSATTDSRLVPQLFFTALEPSSKAKDATTNSSDIAISTPNSKTPPSSSSP